MYHYILKSLKIGFWFLTPILFISNADVEPKEVSNDFQGRYTLDVSGAFQQSLNGTVSFETILGSTNEGKRYSSLALKFKNGDPTQEHEMEFLITKQDRSEKLATGKYKLSQNTEGFLDSFEGVFGYANIDLFSEIPFFTSEGKLVITQIGESNLRGYVDVTLKNNSGEEIVVMGNFNALVCDL